jgi:hypothetical protein
MNSFQAVLSTLLSAGVHYLGVVGMIGFVGVVLGKLSGSRVLLFGGGLILGIEFYHPVLTMVTNLEHATLPAQSINLSGISRTAGILFNQLRS